MTPFNFNTTPSVVFANGAAARLGPMTVNCLGARVLFVTDPGLRQLGLCDAALESLAAEGAEVVVFDKVEADPSRATLMSAVQTGLAAQVSGVVGFGGGSSLDVAKLSALLIGSGEDLDEAWGVGQANRTHRRGRTLGRTHFRQRGKPPDCGRESQRCLRLLDLGKSKNGQAGFRETRASAVLSGAI